MYSDWELDVQNANKKEEQTRYITGLVHEFFKGGGDMGVLERWLTELGVDWVLRLANGACAGNQLMEHAFFDAWRSWIRALAEIVETIGFTTSLFADRGGGSISVGMHIIVSKEEEQAAPDQFQFARFFKQTMLKMLACVDFLACEQVLVSNSNGFDASYEEEKLSFLLGVHGALSKALPQVRLSSSSCSIQGDMVRLLAAKEAMAGEAIWSKMEEMKTRILESIEEDGNDSSSGTIEGSSDIHRATRTVISYIRLLRTNYSTLARLVSEAATLGKYVPQIGIGELPPLDSMIIEMASCLEEKLANKSESFSDQRLRFMFLLNNSYFIWQQVQPIWSIIEFNANATDHKFLSFTKTHMTTVTRKAEGYMESYLQASWAPVLQCLFSTTTTPLCLGKKSYSSALNNFESEFQKTYTTQKLWKVPDPGLRKSLRKAITKKLMSSYTKYIDDNDITTPRVAPQELEERLQELFEG
jgi:hypothetical protein